MRIAIDARLNAYRQGGIPQYTRQLVTALADVAVEDQIVSLQHRDQLRPLAIAPNVVRRTALTPPHHRFEQWALPLEVLLARPDVLHCPDFIAPTRRFCPAVVTIHDLAFMHYPEILDISARAYYSQVTSNAPRADAIIAVSESTRQDIAQFLDIPIEQIDVIYEAAAPLYTQLDLREGEARVLNSTPVAAGTFMLFVSTLEPRKNLPTLLQALRICIDRRPEAGYRLVIVGRRGWRDDAIFQTARDLKLADHVLFTGNVGQYDLRWLYNACRLYINPSLYEGFGLPLLEAMACGAACLAAATSSLPEIGGDAAIYVPPLEAEQWADQIMALWDDEDRRAELGRMGIARAQQFSWNRTARETLKVYRRAVERIVPRAEPHPAPRQSQPPEPLPAHTLAVLGLDALRPCLRCGTALLPGDLQIGMSRRSADSTQAGPPMIPRLWSCPRCGYVELVDATHLAAHHDHTEDSVADMAPALEAAPVANAALIDMPSTPEDEPVASAAPAELEVPDAPVEDLPVMGAALPDQLDELDELVEDVQVASNNEWSSDSAALEDLPVTSAALPDQLDGLVEDVQVASSNEWSGDSAALEDPPVTSAGLPDQLDELVEDVQVASNNEWSGDSAALEDPPVTSAALSDQLDELVEDVQVASSNEWSGDSAALEDPPVMSVVLPDRLDAPVEDVQVTSGIEWPGDSAALEDVPVEDVQVTSVAPAELELSDEQAGLEARAVASSEVSSAAITSTLPDSSTFGTAHTAHSSHSPNGAALKPKSNHRSRRQPPTAEPATKQPAKRRSGGSKRKQTM